MSGTVRSPVRVLILGTLLLWQTPSFTREPDVARTDEQQAASSVSRVIRYSILIRNPTDKLVQSGSVQVYAPLREGSSHRLLSVQATSAYAVTYDELKNAVIHVKVAELAPHAVRAIAIEALIEIRAQDGGAQQVMPSTYSLPDDLVKSNHPAIAEVAKQLMTQSRLDSARAWVAAGVRYGGYALEAKGALRTLQEREGDCTEYAYLVVALARAIGIPARVVGGFVMEDNPRFRIREQHDWAEVYVDGKWWVADSQRRVFGAAAEAKYVGFRVTSPRSKATPELQRFAASAPLLVEMQ